jgi:hypothetical protein
MKGEKMRYIPCIALALASFASAQAQSPNAALTIGFTIPTGEFREKIYLPTPDEDFFKKEGYDVGFGCGFSLSFPMNLNMALRTGIGFVSSGGTNTAPGYETIFLRHNNVMLTGELQFFTKNAYRHAGTYFVAGISGNFERFERSFDKNWDSWSEKDVDRTSRLGGIVGIGHTFYSNGGLNFVTELSFHTTLTGKDFYREEPPAANYIKISFGMAF